MALHALCAFDTSAAHFCCLRTSLAALAGLSSSRASGTRLEQPQLIVHMCTSLPSGGSAARQRACRLSTAQATAIRLHVMSCLPPAASEWSGEADTEFGLLLRRAWHAGPDELAALRTQPGPHPIMEALRERARRCVQASEPQVSLSLAGDGGLLPALAPGLVRLSWRAVIRHRRSSCPPEPALLPGSSVLQAPSGTPASPSASSPPPSTPALPTSAATPRRSIPIGGRLPPPDRPLPPPHPSRALVAACLRNGPRPPPAPPRRHIQRIPLRSRLADCIDGRTFFPRHHRELGGPPCGAALSSVSLCR